MAFQRLAAAPGQGETDQFADRRLRLEDLHGALADEERLAAGDGPVHVDLGRAGHAVGVLADDHVALFQAQQALGLDPERTNVMRLAGLHQRVPQRLAVARRCVDLVPQFADETHP